MEINGNAAFWNGKKYLKNKPAAESFRNIWKSVLENHMEI